ncbi:LysR family transcriptional regulator [Bradyrhizobium sp. DOA9]|uniref:LysR family transcriptional regulator n=1 Tax=Bradyrhizobium sp. DOA9 TaxID=1126627 RepID=UPI00046827E7|nr:LysR family transcriptional regulator [Bradyrhizobium sp. DOA9]
MQNSRRRKPSLQACRVIELKHLRSAIAAADCGSLRQAADLLRTQQSSLSRRIDELDHHLGIAVFERCKSGVRPTRAGLGILRQARAIFEEFDALVANAGAVQNSEAGRLAIGFCTSLSAGNLQASLTEFSRRFPLIDVVTSERSRTRLATALRNGALDILIVTGSLPLLENQVLPLWSERVLIVFPQNHALAAREVVYWTDLRGETVLLSHYDPGTEFEALLTSKLVSPQDRPKIERHYVSHGIIKGLISMKTGISLVLESDIGANFAGLVYRELRDEAGPSCLQFSAYRRGENENPALAAFLDMASSRYGSAPPGR